MEEGERNRQCLFPTNALLELAEFHREVRKNLFVPFFQALKKWCQGQEIFA